MTKNEEKFKQYLTTIGYIQYVKYIVESVFGVDAILTTDEVKLKHFSSVARRGKNTLVSLSKNDYENKLITKGLF